MKPIVLLFLVAAYASLPAAAQSSQPDILKQDSVLDGYIKGLTNAIKIDSSYLEADYLGKIGLYYNSKNDFKKAIEYFERGLIIANRIKDTTYIAGFMLNQGMIYKKQGDYTNALKRLQQSADLLQIMYERHHNPFDEEDLASVLNSMANIHLTQESYTLAYQNLIKSIELRKKYNNQIGLAGSLNYLGEYHFKMKQYYLALHYFNTSLNLKKELIEDHKAPPAFTSSTLLNIGSVYKALSYLHLAEKNIINAIQVAKNNDTTSPELPKAYMELATLYFEQKKYSQAMQAIVKGQPYAERLNLRTVIRQNYNLLRKLYRLQDKMDLALTYDELYIQLNDSIVNEQKNRTREEMIIRYDSETKDRKMQSILHEREAEKNRILIMIVSICVLSIAILISIRSLRREKILLRKEKEDKNKIEMLMAELSHRWKNNLQLLLSVLHMQQDRLDDPGSREAVQEIENRVRSMAHIHQQFYRNEHINTINLKEYLSAIVKDLVHSYGSSAGVSMLDYKEELEDISISNDRAMLIGLIANEMISNSFKHAFKDIDNPGLSISLYKADEQSVGLRICDNGTAILVKEHIEKADSFGLKLIRLLTKQLKAELKVENDRGVCYTLIIPKSPR